MFGQSVSLNRFSILWMHPSSHTELPNNGLCPPLFIFLWKCSFLPPPLCMKNTSYVFSVGVTAETQEAASNIVKREFDLLEIGVNETVAEYFARLHIVLTERVRNQVTTPAREIKRRALCGLTPRLCGKACVYTMNRDFDLKNLGAGLARVASFQSDHERRITSARALTVVHAGGGRAGAAMTVNALQSATAVVEVAISSSTIHNRRI